MFDNWKHKLPTREKIFASRWFKPFAHLFDKPEYWAFKRDKVALSVAIGFFLRHAARANAIFLRADDGLSSAHTIAHCPFQHALHQPAHTDSALCSRLQARQSPALRHRRSGRIGDARAGRARLLGRCRPLDAPIRPAAGRSNSASRWPSAYSSWALPLPSPAMRWCKSSGAGASTASKPGANAGSAEKKAATFNTQMQTKCKQAPSSRHAAAAV